MARAKLKDDDATQLIGSFVTEANMVSKKIDRIGKIGVDIRKLANLHKELVSMSGAFDKINFIDQRSYPNRTIEIVRVPSDFREKLLSILKDDIVDQIEKLKRTIYEVAKELNDEFPKHIEDEKAGGSGQPAT